MYEMCQFFPKPNYVYCNDDAMSYDDTRPLSAARIDRSSLQYIGIIVYVDRQKQASARQTPHWINMTTTTSLMR